MVIFISGEGWVAAELYPNAIFDTTRQIGQGIEGPTGSCPFNQSNPSCVTFHENLLNLSGRNTRRDEGRALLPAQSLIRFWNQVVKKHGSRWAHHELHY